MRMHSDKAKGLHEVLGAPMVSYVMKTVVELNPQRTLVVIGYQADDVKKATLNSSLSFVSQKSQRGTGDALLACEDELKDCDCPVFVLGGDTPLISPDTLKNLLAEHVNSKADATVLTACIDDPTGYGRIVRDKSGRLDRIVEENDATPKEKEIAEINSGIYIFNPATIFPVLKKIKPDNKKGEYYLTDTIAILRKEGRTVACAKSPNPSEVCGINTRKDLVAITNFLRWRILEEKMDAGVTIVDPSTTFIETNVEIGTDTIIHPFTVIRRNVKIGRQCEVGPYSHLRSGTVLEDFSEVGNFVEVKKTRLGSHSKAKHLSYLGDATIGKNVNIGAGTITANYDGKEKHPTTIEDGCSTGSGTVLVAPVKMGKNSKTGAGAIVTKGQDVAEGNTVVGVPAKSIKKEGTALKR